MNGRWPRRTSARCSIPTTTRRRARSCVCKQQYFFVACSLRDIIRRFRLERRLGPVPRQGGHPAQRHASGGGHSGTDADPGRRGSHLDWDQAWDHHPRTPSPTPATPCCPKRWRSGRSVSSAICCRGIWRSSTRSTAASWTRCANVSRRRRRALQRMSLIEEGPQRRCAWRIWPAWAASRSTAWPNCNRELLRERTLRDFAEMWPEKFHNKTNGVTPRRFMRLANPRLSELITDRSATAGSRDLDQLRQLEPLADDAEFRAAWRKVKQDNKQALADHVQEKYSLTIDPTSMYDVKVKRLHEYKRQLLKALHIMTLYHRIKADPSREVLPRTFVFGAKAAPGYHMAKLIIKLINNVAEVVNNDPDVRGRLKVVFPANFNVSLAEKIYPAADISEQISMAGKEASGTGNMVEIRECVGEENFFLFGLTVDEVLLLSRERGYNPIHLYHGDAGLTAAIDAILAGEFFDATPSCSSHRGFVVVRRRLHAARRLRSYIDCSERPGGVYKDPDGWTP